MPVPISSNPLRVAFGPMWGAQPLQSANEHSSRMKNLEATPSSFEELLGQASREMDKRTVQFSPFGVKI